MRLFIVTILFLSQQIFAQDSISVLFIGNSYTYVNDLPEMLFQFANSKGDKLTVDSKTNGGFTFANHLQDPLTHQKIKAKPWDFVVLQGQSQEPSFPYNQVNTQTYPPAKNLADSVFESNFCSQVMYFMTWGRKTGDPQWDSINTFDKMNSRLYNAYMNMMNFAESSVSPVAVAWKKVIDTYPDIELFSGDGSHPSLAGSYLSCCVFYAALYRKSPLNTAYFAGLDPLVANILQETAHDVVMNDIELWKLRAKDKIAIADFTFSQLEQEVTFTNTSWRSSQFYWNFGDSQESFDENPIHTFNQTGNFEVMMISSNECGSDTSSTIISIQVNNINSSNNKQLVCKTNNDGTFTFIFPENVDSFICLVMNQAGQLISEFQSKEVINSHTCDLSQFPSGIYTIHFLSGNRTFTYKTPLLNNR